MDEVQKIDCPILVGAGIRFFPDGIPVNLELIENPRFGGIVVVLRCNVQPQGQVQ